VTAEERAVQVASADEVAGRDELGRSRAVNLGQLIDVVRGKFNDFAFREQFPKQSTAGRVQTRTTHQDKQRSVGATRQGRAGYGHSWNFNDVHKTWFDPWRLKCSSNLLQSSSQDLEDPRRLSTLVTPMHSKDDAGGNVRGAQGAVRRTLDVGTSAANNGTAHLSGAAPSEGVLNPDVETINELQSQETDSLLDDEGLDHAHDPTILTRAKRAQTSNPRNSWTAYLQIPVDSRVLTWRVLRA